VTDVAAPILDVSEPETKGERTRQRILALAVDRFGTRGYRATSVSEIARAAGLTQAASYAYFDSKESLFAAAVDHDASALLADAWTAVNDESIDLLVPSLVTALMAGLDNHPLAARVLAGNEPDAVPRLVDLPALERFGERLAGVLREAQAEGRVRPDVDPAVVSGGIEALMLGVLFAWVQAKGTSKRRHVVGVTGAFGLMLCPPRLTR
jgi:AcrR family transcriptional regulator